MLKKLSLKRFSLQKQLILIFVMIAFVVVAILLPLVESNVSNIVDRDSYSILERSQNNYINYNFLPEDSDENKQIYHFTYDSINNIIYPTGNVTKYKAQMMLSAFESSLKELVNSQGEKCKDKGSLNHKTVYYVIKKADDNSYIISLMYSDYTKSLSTAMRQELIYIFYGAFGLLALILFIWVSSLIKPLRQIKKYTEDVKNKKEASLDVERGDEIGSVATSLVNMKEELDKQGQIKEEMIHNISHDLKTPIALIKTYTQSVKDGVYPYGDKDSSLDVVLENADRLDNKVKSLLYLNRLDYLSGEETSGMTEMKELIEHIISQMTSIKPDVEVELHLLDKEFKGNEDHWRICIENILANAYRYVQHKIIITLKEDYLEIFNDGEAIKTIHFDDLFEPYRKGTKGEFGLGLSIVYKTVSLYDYSVEAFNRQDGVSFIIKKNPKK